MTLAARIIPPAALSSTDRDAMYALMDRHYENMRRPQFEADLAEKDWVILLADEPTGSVCGFSTQRLITVEVDGRPVRCVFSGDTIIDREHWGSGALATAFGKLACHWIEQFPNDELFWYLISKGFRTYRVLTVYFREFFPRFDAETPADLRRIVDAVSLSRFPERYDWKRGVVKAKPDSDRLRPGVGDVTPERLLDPHVKFFEERNPGHVDGDELCCIARLRRDNFSAIAQKLIRSTAFARQRIG